VFDIAGPLVVYQLLRSNGHSEVTSLVISGAFPVLGVLLTIIRDQRLDVIGVLVLIGIAVGVSIGLASHDAKLVLLEGAVPTAIFAPWWTTIITTPRGETSQRTPDASPTLRRAVGELHRDACAWFEEHRESWMPPHRDPGRDWPIAKSAAEAAASDRGVSLEDVHADTQLLLVDGNWWQRPAPGVLCYSPAVYVDEIQLHQLLRETFVSSV
jgi:hypothetical protein